MRSESRGYQVKCERRSDDVLTDRADIVVYSNSVASNSLDELCVIEVKKYLNPTLDAIQLLLDKGAKSIPVKTLNELRQYKVDQLQCVNHVRRLVNAGPGPRCLVC